MTSDLLAYAGCLQRFTINAKGYVQIEIFSYDSSIERFMNVSEKPLIPSTTLTSKTCTIVSSHVMDKGLLVLLHLITSTNSILMFLQLQSRPWSCQILHTLAMPSTIEGSLRFLATNRTLTLFLTDESNRKGFYRIHNREGLQRTIELIPCSLLTYLYCYLKEHYYWLMGQEMETDSERKSIKVYYHCTRMPSKTLVPFDTQHFIPLTLTDKIQDIYVLRHRIQLRTQSILGDVIVATTDHRIFVAHDGTISHELLMDHPISKIYFYQNVDDEQLVLFFNEELRSVQLFQFEQNFTLTPHMNAHETADTILIDDFTQSGWKQILFLKNPFDLDAFLLTDFSQIHAFQQGSEHDFHTHDKLLEMEKSEDSDTQASLAVARDILRKKIIEADFIVMEGQYQCRQIENEIRQISNQHYVPDLNSHLKTLQALPNANNISTLFQLLDTNWFIYRNKLYVHVTIKNTSSTSISAAYIFAVDQHANRLKRCQLISTDQSIFNEKKTFVFDAYGSLTFILTTTIELDQDIHLQLCLFQFENQKLFRLGSIHVTMDEVMNPKSQRVLKLNDFNTEFQNSSISRQVSIYLNTFIQVGIAIQSTSKFVVIEDFRRLLLSIGFKQIDAVSNGYLRIDEGNLFEHAVIQLVNADEFMTDDDLLVHFYTENLRETVMLIRYVLSKLDFQTFSLIPSLASCSEQYQTKLIKEIQRELNAYIDAFKQIPTVMRKITPTSKSEPYRLLKSENFRLFENERQPTDLLIGSLIID